MLRLENNRQARASSRLTASPSRWFSLRSSASRYDESFIAYAQKEMIVFVAVGEARIWFF